MRKYTIAILATLTLLFEGWGGLTGPTMAAAQPNELDAAWVIQARIVHQGAVVQTLTYTAPNEGEEEWESEEACNEFRESDPVFKGLLTVLHAGVTARFGEAEINVLCVEKL